jgi:hypothetical protein
VAKSMLSDEELDHLLSRASRTQPVDRAALDDARVLAALASLRHDIESGKHLQGPTKLRMRRFYRRRWVTLGAATAAVAVASLVGVETLTGEGGGAGLPLAVSPAAAAQLNGVAHAAAGQAMPGAGQWEYLEVKNEATATVSARNAVVAYSSTQTQQSWIAPAQGDTDSAVRGRDTNDGFSFLTPQDQATYLANKSAFDAGAVGQAMASGVTQDKLFPSDGGQLPVWETSPTSDPQTLIAEIWKQFVSEHSGPGVVTGDLNAQRPGALWTVLNNLLLDSTSAQLRSTAYAAIAYVQGAKVLGNATDQLGRSGIEISFREIGNNFRQTLIVSPTTGDPLEYDMTLESIAGGLPATYALLPIGTVVQRLIFLQRAVVNSDTALPNGGSQPIAAPTPTTTAPTQTTTTSAAQTTTTAAQG